KSPHGQGAAEAAHGPLRVARAIRRTRVPLLPAVYFIRNAGFAMLYLAMIFSIVPSFFITAICSFMAFTSAGLSRRELKTVYALFTVSGMYSLALMASYLRFPSGCCVPPHPLPAAPPPRPSTPPAP